MHSVKIKQQISALGIALVTAISPADASEKIARFSWFEYNGNDEVFNLPLKENEYRNPILAGFHPDPSIVRVDKDYYLVNSTFGFFPGIPVFHSRDLVNWTQIGNALHRPGQVNFNGLPLTNAGVYAPAIEYRDGTFYVINTCIGCGGNFVVTAKNPAGPWSDPIWLPELDGIDPSIFFDDNGKTYIVHHAEPDKKRYPAHTAIRVMEVDPETFQAKSDDVLLVDGGAVPQWNTDYLEGPHLYNVDGTYYLSAPGGGTGYFHQQLLFRADNVFGPYTANPNNPVLTQFGLPDDRPNPVTATGHADLFEDSNGDWWAVFLGTRVYDLATAPQDPGNFHTGRETFMLPVQWKDGWPIILEAGRALPYAVNRPRLPEDQPAPRHTTGNFSEREVFVSDKLAPHWLFIRTPDSPWWATGDEGLSLQARPVAIGDRDGQPSFVGRRLAHMRAEMTTALKFTPQATDDEAGLLALQSDDFFYALGLGRNSAGKAVLRVRRKAGNGGEIQGQVIAETPIPLLQGQPVYLRMKIDKSELDFSYSLDAEHYTPLVENNDARVLTTAAAGGFVGAVVGMYAESGEKIRIQERQQM
ncbi:glycoside hydrolase family 43 protein [Microbulbifer bruguierae]|uniref:Glycoside hydrolase family 43 protein n=1 Tax=Microbulbifer bruguierae TaxID=3029061 RepID=A0ABY8NJ69_9GAMM|nr:glycoside hydrolase family 43 protein [Microbulbifer bruguierae]WGL18384.1 glycoside hydrolase family 43 protein [Microbulbifer bruguierae]